METTVSLSNLTITASSQDFVGLFGRIDGGHIKNLGIENATITGHDNVGSLVGFIHGNFHSRDTITACYATGLVSGSNYVGGLVGCNRYRDCANITTCYTAGTVNASGMYVGGMVGYNDEGKAASHPVTLPSPPAVTGVSEGWWGLSEAP